MALFGLLACAPEPDPSQKAAGEPASPPDSSPDFQGRVYQRTVVFMTWDQQLPLILTWSFTARTRPGGVERTSRGWLGRDGSWDPFYSVRWQTPPSRAPWRILPRRPLRLLVGQGDALERFIYREGARFVEMAFGATLAEWIGQQGETFRVQDARLLFSGEDLGGLILDMARARGTEDPVPGSWAFLGSGDSLQLVVEDPGLDADARDPRIEEGGAGAFRAWARFEAREAQWPDVSVSWEETRAFEEARRDVPVVWSLSSRDRELEGWIESENAWLEAGEGQGPVFPVEALHEVRGQVRIQGSEYPVWGLFRHVQR